MAKTVPSHSLYRYGLFARNYRFEETDTMFDKTGLFQFPQVQRSASVARRQTLIAAVVLCLVACLALTATCEANLIRGGEGNKPIDDPGWPAGAAVLFNHEGRIAWWEGPPF